MEELRIENHRGHSQFSIHNAQFTKRLVGLGRFELPTSRLSGVRSNQLSYRPVLYPACRSIAASSQPPSSSAANIDCQRTRKEAGSLKTEQDRSGRQALLRFLST